MLDTPPKSWALPSLSLLPPSYMVYALDLYKRRVISRIRRPPPLAFPGHFFFHFTSHL